ncbi:uncharacterized protein [Danio rerio]|uniref:6-phosphofructo-2-kinase/fructose-2, 6-bisphosphatase 2a isoform X1 n=4 Tax=Danio rerio TaxID=7955 RepID=A0AC58IJ74_DANRE|nr:uncharacterized protein LOC100149327 [Danio rerio]XP_021327224.1 uncharacterized protein LOC110438631 [Danio rerio]|eukprot:XP_001921592.2 uncharacterized protein LOC100149327 [Danio rerio]
MPPREHPCAILGCKAQHKSLHRLPANEQQRLKWLSFIFEDKVPENVPKLLYVCANHFSVDCLENAGQYNSGFASKLFLKTGSVPTIRDPVSLQATTSTKSNKVDVACQTEPFHTSLHSVGTQLSFRTLQAKRRSTSVQTTISSFELTVPSASSTAFMTSTPLKPSLKRPRLELEEEEEEEEAEETLTESKIIAQDSDVTFDPAEECTSATEPTDLSIQECPVHNIAKFIVYETCLMELFSDCPVCQRRCDVKSQRLGTFLSVQQVCPHCEFVRKWNSQPIIGSTPAGNLHLSAAVYLSGASFFVVEKVFAAMKLHIFKYNSFRRHARLCIEPAIVHKWRNWQSEMLEQLSRRENVIVGGDMRADSPGHSAKYGSYTMMDLATNTVVDLQLVQSNEVGGSYHMEKEGLKRSLDLLDARGVRLECIITDRHPQIQKYLRDRNVTQFYDVWHIEKGISKKLDKICQIKGCEKLRKWLRSIKNHIYWTAASSTTGPERVAKWTSILNHVQDKHVHEDPNFPACLHPQRISRDKNKWLSAATMPFYKLEKVLANKRILKDVAKLSPHHQTSTVEAFHSVILRFAPKNVVFPFLGMLCRLYLAALHYNENAGRPQATSATGKPIYKLAFPKAKKGEYRVREVKTQQTFGYVEELLDLIFNQVFVDPSPYVDEVLGIHIPPALSSAYDRPEMEEAISSRVTRFNQ